MFDDYISDDDVIQEGEDESWFSIGMTREQKIEGRRPWRGSLIVKLIGRSIGYHKFLRRIQAMWRTQDDLLPIDLGFKFFVVKLGKREGYERALTEGSWMIGITIFMSTIKGDQTSSLRRRSSKPSQFGCGFM